MSTRGTWRYNEETGELEEQPHADYPAEAEKQKQRELRDAAQDEQDKRGGAYL